MFELLLIILESNIYKVPYFIQIDYPISKIQARPRLSHRQHVYVGISSTVTMEIKCAAFVPQFDYSCHVSHVN